MAAQTFWTWGCTGRQEGSELLVWGEVGEMLDADEDEIKGE